MRAAIAGRELGAPRAALVAALLALGCSAAARPPAHAAAPAGFESEAALEGWLDALVRSRNEVGPLPVPERVDDELRGPPDAAVRAFAVRPDRAVFALGCVVFEARIEEDGLAFVGRHRVAPPPSRCPPAHRSGDSILVRVERPRDGAAHVVEVVRVALREPWGIEAVESVALRFPERPASLDALAGFFGRFALASGPHLGVSAEARRLEWPAMQRAGGPWRRWPEAERIFAAPAPTGDPWAHVLVACEVEASLVCRSAGLIASMGWVAASGDAVFVAEAADSFTRVHRLTLEGAGSVRAPGRLPGDVFDVSEADGRVRTLLVRDHSDGVIPTVVDAAVARFAPGGRVLEAGAGAVAARGRGGDRCSLRG